MILRVSFVCPSTGTVGIYGFSKDDQPSTSTEIKYYVSGTLICDKLDPKILFYRVVNLIFIPTRSLSAISLQVMAVYFITWVCCCSTVLFFRGAKCYFFRTLRCCVDCVEKNVKVHSHYIKHALVYKVLCFYSVSLSVCIV